MGNNENIIQISIDILAKPNCKGIKIAEELMYELRKQGYTVVGASVVEDAV